MHGKPQGYADAQSRPGCGAQSQPGGFCMREIKAMALRPHLGSQRSRDADHIAVEVQNHQRLQPGRTAAQSQSAGDRQR